MTSRWRLSAAALAVATLAGCTPDAPTSQPEPRAATPSPVAGGTLRFGVIGSPATLDVLSERASDLTFYLARPTLARALRFVSDGTHVSVLGGRAQLRRAGPFKRVAYEPGLKIVFDARPGSENDPLLDRIVVFFIESLDVALELLDAGRLDAASLPASVNLDERLDEMGLEHAEALGYEAVHMHFDPQRVTRREWIAVARRVDRDAIAEGLIRDDGRLTDTLRPTPDDVDGAFANLVAMGAEPPGTLRLATPAGDELLDLIQRAVQIQLGRHGVEVEILSVPAATFYGRWIDDPQVEALLVRTMGTPGLADPPRDVASWFALPIAHVETVVAWRRGVHGLVPNPTLEGPLWNAHEWWKDPAL
ncbi:MAG: ABC transporter substrate-binding protein [Actinomycetota bacterium]|nr:ABC transporter substrate-binding protein [Actinomycetota bacterium]